MEAVIQEEIQRAMKSADIPDSETFGSTVAHVKHFGNVAIMTNDQKIQELEREIIDLRIANRGKDYLIDQLQGERTGFFEKLVSANRTMGQLKAKLHQDDPKI